MQGNKFSGAPPALNWVRRLDPRTKLCLLLASFVMVLLPESPQVVAVAPGAPETPPALLAPIFLLTLRRSQAMAWALEARGFQMSPRRTYLLEVHMVARDWLALAVAGLLLAGAITLHLLCWDRSPGLRV